MENYTSIFPESAFPNLGTLILHFIPWHSQLGAISASLSKHGGHLHTIHLTYRSQHEHLLPASALFPIFNQSCPNLREVIFTLTALLIEPQLELCAKERNPLRGVTTFSVQMTDPPDARGWSRMGEGHWMLLLDLVSYWAVRLLDPEQICFSEDTNVDTLRDSSHADEVQTFLDDIELLTVSRKRTIAVKDRFGEPLQVRHGA